MKKYIEPIADIVYSTSHALLIFSLALSLLGGGGLMVLTVIKIKNILPSMRDAKSSSMTLNIGVANLLQILQIAAILAVVVLGIVILSTCLNYASKCMKKHINE